MPESQGGVFDKMRRFITSAQPVKKDFIRGLNTSPRLGRCDAAYRRISEIFGNRALFMESDSREKLYRHAQMLANDIIRNLEFITEEQKRVGARIAPDPGFAALQTIRSLIGLLDHVIENMACFDRGEKAIESFGGAPALAKLRLLDDCVGELEVNMFHSVSEFIDAMALAMQKNTEQHKHSFSKSELERYNSAYREFYEYYALPSEPKQETI